MASKISRSSIASHTELCITLQIQFRLRDKRCFTSCCVDVYTSYIKVSKMQRYVTLGILWAAARWQDNYEKVGVPQTATKCQNT
jgi:hypothetical protein